jgi:hypothetical protein
MLLPRYSIRTVFYLAGVVAVVALIAGEAVQGRMWAAAIVIGVGSLAVTWAMCVLFYGMVALFSRVTGVHGTYRPRPAHYPALRTNVQSADTSPATSQDS